MRFHSLLIASALPYAHANADISFLTFEDGNNDQASFTMAAGSFIYPEPKPIGSGKCGRYIRNSAIQWDWSLFQTPAIANASLFLNGDISFEMEVLSYDAPIGTQIDITIEDSSVTAAQDFPAGRHSRYKAITTAQGTWEKLQFTLLDQPDASVGNDGISAIVISYATVIVGDGSTFFVDNLVGVSSISTIFYDEFTAPNPWDTSVWLPRLPLTRSIAMSGVASSLAQDGFAATLLYPKDRPASEWGPRYSTQIMSADANMYGHYEARLKSGRANPGEGVISAFFIYRNDEIDHDGDGMIDNHEIDFELLNSDRSSIWTSVYTDYQYIDNIESFHRNGARIDISTGSVYATTPGNEGNWDLNPIAPLGWSIPGFDHSASVYTYGFDWMQEKVSFWIDLEDGVGRRALFEVFSDGSNGPNDHIPSMPASTFVNIWHTNVDWWSRAIAPQLTLDAIMEIDYVTVNQISTRNNQTWSPTFSPTKSPSPPIQCDVKGTYCDANNNSCCKGCQLNGNINKINKCK